MPHPCQDLAIAEAQAAVEREAARSWAAGCAADNGPGANISREQATEEGK